MLNAGVASLPLAIGQTFPGILVFTYKDDILPFLLRSIIIQVILVAMPYNLVCQYRPVLDDKIDVIVWRVVIILYRRTRSMFSNSVPFVWCWMITLMLSSGVGRITDVILNC
jgi:hypothetical protein